MSGSSRGEHDSRAFTVESASETPIDGFAKDAEREGLQRRLAEAELLVENERARAWKAALRASRLARATAALKRTVQSLGSPYDVDALLGHTLGSITEQLGVKSATAWLFDSEGRSHLIWVSEEGRAVRGQDSRHPNATKPIPQSTFRSHWSRELHGSFQMPLAVSVAEDPALSDEHRAYLEALGVKALVNVPIIVEGEPVGLLTLNFESDAHALGDDLELIHALADQATLAFRLRHLVGDAQQAALARERELAAEERAAHLARTNRVLRETVESLRAADGMGTFVSASLKAMAEQVRAPLGFLFLVNEDESLRLAWLFDEGRLVVASEAPDPFAYGERTIPASLYRHRWREAGLDHSSPNIVIYSNPGMSEEERRYLQARGIDRVVTVPIVLDKRIIGTFVLGVSAEHRLSPDDRELMSTIANQTSLALRLAGLAADARATALAQQEEQAARLRAESVTRLRERVDRAVGRLAAIPDVDASLGEVLTEVVQQFGAMGGSIWRVEADDVARLALTFESGEVRPPAKSDHLGLLVAEQPVRFTAHPKRGEIRIDDEQRIASHPDYAGFREFLTREGVRAIVVVPMYLGESFKGAFTLRFAGPPYLTAEDKELLQTFSNQTLLAMELTRLARAARGAAVSEERSRMARDIHDTVAQGLAAIIRQLESAMKMGVKGTAVRAVSVAIEIARDSLAEARRSIWALRPASLDGRTFQAAVRDLAQRLGRLSSAVIQARTSGHLAAIPADVENQLLRILHEALTNAIKHASALSIDVDVSMEDGGVRIVVRDDGSGFDPGAVAGGVGLSAMHERAQQIDAAVTIASEPGKGTEVLVYWSASASKGETD